MRRIVLAALLCAALAACGTREAGNTADSADVFVSVSQGRITAPDTIRPGWTRVRVTEPGGGHIVVILRLPPSASAADIGAFVAAMDTAVATPLPVVALGGPEIGDVGDVVVQFAPGRYVFVCVRRSSDGHRHPGESKPFIVLQSDVDSAHATAPQATQTLRMVDFAYTGPEKWAAGAQMIRVSNEGAQDHQLRLVRLKAGSSIDDWMKADDPDSVGTPIAGVARMGPGQVAYLPVTLSPGAYVAYCLVTDPKTRKMHIELGMMRSIQVE